MGGENILLKFRKILNINKIYSWYKVKPCRYNNKFQVWLAPGKKLYLQSKHGNGTNTTLLLTEGVKLCR